MQNNERKSRKPPDLCPGWYRKILEQKEKTATLPVNWDDTTGVMSRDVIDSLRFECLPELDISDIELEE